MANEVNKQKQEGDEDSAPAGVKREGHTAQDLGEASAYNDSTEMAQQMRRGDETVPDADERDVVGATTSANTDNKPVPRHQRSADDTADKMPETKEN